jgi:hypothetical protein
MPAMTVWKPHALAHPESDQLDMGLKRKLPGGFKRIQRVIAIRDLDGVPSGTVGRILLANGFNWLRYRVLFENGVELADLTGHDIEPARKSKKNKQK